MTTPQITRLADAVTITPRTDIEVVRLVEAVKADQSRIIRTAEELLTLDADTALIDATGETFLRSDCTTWQGGLVQYHVDDLPAVVIATGAQVRAARKALEES